MDVLSVWKNGTKNGNEPVFRLEGLRYDPYKGN